MSHPSPDSWHEQLIYFLLPDRFSDTSVTDTNRLTSDSQLAVPPGDGPLTQWYWNHWAISGRNRFQGGTIAGIMQRLPYLQKLGVTALWIGPVWKQRAAGVDVNAHGSNTDDPYIAPLDKDIRNPRPDPDAFFREVQRPRDDPHGYSVQDFTEVDPRFGTKAELRQLVDAAHELGIYVILDVLYNHSGENFSYDVPLSVNAMRPPFVQPGTSCLGARYGFGRWLDADNEPLPLGQPPNHPDDGVWPESLQHGWLYNRYGSGSYGSADTGSPRDELRLADSFNRDFRYSNTRELEDPMFQAIVKIWSDWIDDTDCDGFRVDTFKHVPRWVSEEFVAVIRAHAATKGKNNFLIMAEIGGNDREEALYAGIDGLSILELGDRRNDLRALAGGDVGRAPTVLTPGAQDGLPSDLLVMTVDDHDGLNLPRQWRLAAEHGPSSVLPAAALLLFGPSIPCLYYGTEQALRGPLSPDAAGNLRNYGWLDSGRGGDRYLREAMFGPLHPRKAGLAGRPGTGVTTTDVNLPGFGPGGSAGYHVFLEDSVWCRGVGAMALLRKDAPTLLGRGEITLLRQGRINGGRLGTTLPDTIVAWQRRDRAGRWAVIVVDFAPDGSPSNVIDLVLPVPQVAPTPGRVLRLHRSNPLQDPLTQAGDLPVDTSEPGVLLLQLGDLQPGDIRIYVAD